MNPLQSNSSAEIYPASFTWRKIGEMEADKSWRDLISNTTLLSLSLQGVRIKNRWTDLIGSRRHNLHTVGQHLIFKHVVHYYKFNC